MTINTDEPFGTHDGADFDDHRGANSSPNHDHISHIDSSHHSSDRDLLIDCYDDPEDGMPLLKKGYGSFSSQIVLANDRITYTWKEIDVFGETKMDNSWGKQMAGRVKSCFRKEKREPIAKRHLLKNVSGVAKSGELLAILGSSGAGKTTLLNALSFRSPPGVKVSPTSVRAINGIPVTASELRVRCAYVQQDDLFIGSLTAKEHLMFQAMLRMDRDKTHKEKLQRVSDVLAELSLSRCANTLIGVPGKIKGLSGGERKRLAFASEALTDPHLLLCDEPTSGLDSFMAHNVLLVLKRLANKGKTIVITIHQPSSELFGMFDKILMLAEGRTAFLGTSAEASDFFSNLGAPCPQNYNPADFYVQILAIAPNREQECRETIKKICDSFAVSQVAQEVLERASVNTKAGDLRYHEKRPSTELVKMGYRASWWTQFYVILWRSWLSVLKEPLLVKVRLLQTIMVSVLIGFIFWDQKLNQDGVMNINGAIFLFLTNMTFQNVFAVINVFCTELAVFMRESRAQLYRTDAYFLGKTLAELPLFLLVPFLFTAVVYPMIGMQPGFYHFSVAVGIVALVANVATSFGYLISCVSNSISMALSIGPPVIIPFLIFGGFFLNSGSVPSYFKWLSYLSWFRYGNEALLINQWAGVMEGDIDCSTLNTTCPTSGKIILETLNFSENNMYLDVMTLITLIIGFRIVACAALQYRTRSKE